MLKAVRTGTHLLYRNVSFWAILLPVRDRRQNWPRCRLAKIIAKRLLRIQGFGGLDRTAAWWGAPLIFTEQHEARDRFRTRSVWSPFCRPAGAQGSSGAVHQGRKPLGVFEQMVSVERFSQSSAWLECLGAVGKVAFPGPPCVVGTRNASGMASLHSWQLG